MPRREGGIADLVRTIVALRSLDLQESAQKLAEDQQRMTGVEQIRSLARSTSDPYQLRSLAPKLGKVAGLEPTEVEQLLATISPSAEAYSTAAVKQGNTAVGGAFEVPAAAAALTGKGVGGLAQETALAQILGGTVPGFDETMSSEFRRGAIERLATGRTPGQAGQESAYLGLPGNERAQGAGVALGTRLSAGGEAQTQLGFAQVRQQEREIADRFSLGQMELALKASANEGAQPGELLSTMEGLRKILTEVTSQDQTMTPAGLKIYGQQYNSFVRRLQQLAPETYANFPLFPEDGSTSATGFFQMLDAYMKGQLTK